MATADAAPGATADEALAKLLLADLVAADLLDGNAASKVLAKIVAGTIKSQDWRLLLAPPSPVAPRAGR